MSEFQGKDRIGVLFGGKSQEHEISVLSAASLMDAIDRDLHEVVPVAIAKDGEWYAIDSDMGGLCALDDPRMGRLIPHVAEGVSVADCPGARPVDVASFTSSVDFVFPMLHGPNGEDGSVQGLFETLGVPYAGCGISSSAVAMDKIMAKGLLAQAGVPVLDYVYTTLADYRADMSGELSRIEEALGHSVYVKPANLGSSVGVSRAGRRAEIANAIAKALSYDHRVIIEKESLGRELEVAVLGNEKPEVGAVGEVVTGGGFYDYDTKYKNNAFELIVPADISADVEERIRDLTILTYKTFDCAGFARLDFFYNEEDDEIYVNEMNTIPGFTQYSMFPRLWAEAGLAYPDLIERIIELGYERYSVE
ncbi:MAG: D-alanine--D-alanine ligase [Clostridiales Family XIII bacterium]|jgi:D-alanine-D-alanine ligase|nr:D-alanine--D-alanine ligase [Clostridiales Family XIII bacterium]